MKAYAISFAAVGELTKLETLKRQLPRLFHGLDSAEYQNGVLVVQVYQEYAGLEPLCEAIIRHPELHFVGTVTYDCLRDYHVVVGTEGVAAAHQFDKQEEYQE